ncbi:MAG: TIGR00159 family protein [Anaerolineae bacterium]|nr:TIGR00159 family protein [Anaerolineae bacterium]
MELIWTLQSLDWVALLDILLIAALLFAISFLFRGTQAVPVLRGTLVLLVIIGVLSVVPGLVALRWLLGTVITGAAITLPIIFQPELRRFMERLGRAGLALRGRQGTEQEQFINDLSATAGRLSERRHGALIVLEREDPLNDFTETGVPLESVFTPQLLLTIFFPKTELHDGAVILRGNRVQAAAAVLPLSAAHDLTQRKIGTRHRAGLGLSEISDAIVIIVSEETGQISVANQGRLIRRLDANRLTTILKAFLMENEGEQKSWWQNARETTWQQLERLRGLFQRQPAPPPTQQQEPPSGEAA